MWWVGFAKIHCKRHYKITLQKTLQNELTKDAAQRMQKDTEKDTAGACRRWAVAALRVEALLLQLAIVPEEPPATLVRIDPHDRSRP